MSKKLVDLTRRWLLRWLASLCVFLLIGFFAQLFLSKEERQAALNSQSDLLHAVDEFSPWKIAEAIPLGLNDAAPELKDLKGQDGILAIPISGYYICDEVLKAAPWMDGPLKVLEILTIIFWIVVSGWLIRRRQAKEPTKSVYIGPGTFALGAVIAFLAFCFVLAIVSLIAGLLKVTATAVLFAFGGIIWFAGFCAIAGTSFLPFTYFLFTKAVEERLGRASDIVIRRIFGP